ncbi:uncharacterized protein LOC121383898 [Gigantopelta aegis]|uniref:uncharacterized protein LOC121383898 n=1 Tax=Gigantopelta aegis TaxID=1735272 RepID=UPI001B887A9D|nr:uncharacterized protein LOC121383898 [Gigantopelta aegis]
MGRDPCDSPLGPPILQQQSRSYHDNLHVYDVHDNLTCMQVEKLPFNIRGVDLVGQNRFLLLQVYDQMSRYTPKYHSALFEGTTSSPVTVTADATIISVSKSGNLLLYNRDNTVMVADWDITSSTFKNRLSLDMEEKPGYVVMSPDEQHVITVSVETRQQLWSTATGKRLAALAESDTNIQSFEEYAPSNRTCLITSSNMYVHRGWSYQTSSVIFCYSLPSGNLLGSVKSPSSHYEVDIIALDKNQQYIIYGTSAGVLINGDKNKYATVAELLTRTVKSSCRRVNGPYSDLKLCGDEELFVVAAVCGEADIYILSAGRRGNLKNQAQLVFNVTGHSQGVLQLIITSNENMLFSAGEDNSVKLWDFDKIMAGIRNKSAQTQLNGVVHRNKGTNDVIDKAAKSKLENWDDNSAVDVVGRTLSLVISSDCESLYLATDKGFLLKRKLKAQTTTMIDTPTSEPANQLLLSKNNKYLCAAIGGNVLVFDTSTDGLLYALEARGKVSCMAEGGDVLVAGQAGMEAQGRIWNLQTGAKIRDFEFLYSLYKTAVNSIGTKICVTMFDYPVMLSAVDCAADDGAILQQPDTMMAACSAMMISPNDLLAAAGSSDGSTRVISTTTGKYLFRMNQRSSVTTSAFTPDSRSLLTAGYRSIYIWDMQDGHLECKLTRHEDFVVNLRFARDGRLLVTSGRDKMIVVWNMEERVSVCVFLAHCHLDILDVAHDLSYIAYGSEIVSLVGVLEPNKVLKSMADGSYVKTVPEQVKKAQSLALSFSGQRVKLQTTSACSIV